MPSRILVAIVIFPLCSSLAQSVPFEICARSNEWQRPSIVVQSTIWNDPRYSGVGPSAYQWTHSFLWNEPDSASITYSNRNLSGLWTDMTQNHCPRRDTERNRWAELWALNYEVTEINLDNLVYSVTVRPERRGFEIIQFRRPILLGDSLASLRFVTTDGVTVDTWAEIQPSVFAPVAR